MSRRTKKDMELMESEVRYYLLQTNNDPHAAHEKMIKEYLTSNQSIPYYIKGVKDFIKVSQQLAIELNRKEQMAKKDKERYEQKETIINYILSLSLEDIKTIYKQYKDNVTHSDKLNIVDVYNLIYSNDMQEKYINQSIINTFSTIYTKMSKTS